MGTLTMFNPQIDELASIIFSNQIRSIEGKNYWKKLAKRYDTGHLDPWENASEIYTVEGCRQIARDAAEYLRPLIAKDVLNWLNGQTIYEGGDILAEYLAARPVRLGEKRREEQPAHENPGIEAAVKAWNMMAARCGLTSVQKLTATRKTKLLRRLKDCGGLDGWTAALAKIENSPFLRGKNARGWKVSFDFIIQDGNFTKLMEGTYDGKPSGGAAANGFVELLTSKNLRD